MFFTRDGKPLDLSRLYEGAECFVIGSGRSITPRHLELIKQPGIITASLNEAAHFIRPDIFYCSDLHEIPLSVLEDPKIQKFFPNYTADKPIYEYRDTNKLIRDFPNTIQCRVVTKSFSRSNYLGGNYIYRQKGPCENFTPFSAIILFNLLYKLGFRTINLLGYDFSSETNRCTYFYDKEYVKKTGTGIAKIRNTLKQLLDIQDEYKIYNCSPRSGLSFFEFRDFEKAIEDNKVKVDHDIYGRSTKERFQWYLKTRSKKGAGG